MQIIDISQFIKDQQLPDSYAQVAKEWFFPVAQQLVVHQKRAKEPLIVGINGAQGSGKSTLAELLVFIFEQHYQIKAVSLSIDDFYYTRKQRVELAEQVESLMKMGILCKETHTYTIRFAPPLIIEQQDIDWAVDKIKTAVEGVPKA